MTDTFPKIIPPKITSSLFLLKSFIEKEKFKGYDPYDTLNSKIPFRLFGQLTELLAIQIQKRNPIHIRPLLGIKKDYNPKAMGLLLHAYSLLQEIQPSGENRKNMNFLFEWLKNNYSKNQNGYCWGYNFDWVSSAKKLKTFSPTIVATGFIAKGIFAYYSLTKNEEAFKIFKSIGDFILKDLPLTEDKTGICLSYSPQFKDCCYNANMLGAEYFSMLYHLTKENRYKELAIKATDFVMARQWDDGHWNYSIDIESGKERSQIDFHQGYVLDSLYSVWNYTERENGKYFLAIKNGLQYYFEKQFLKNGQSIYRVPEKYPVEIHNQSQGIITFSRLCEFDKSYLGFAEKIVEWTIENMQDKKGYFYYKKYSVYTIKIPFMRWSQAWMFLSLTEFLKAQQKPK